MSTQTSPNSYTVLEGQKVGDLEDKLELSRKAKDRYTYPVTRSPTSWCVPQRKSGAGEPGHQHVPSSQQPKQNRHVLTVNGSIRTCTRRRAVVRRASRATCNSSESRNVELSPEWMLQSTLVCFHLYKVQKHSKQNWFFLIYLF